jgi:hypothetical protein
METVGGGHGRWKDENVIRTLQRLLGTCVRSGRNSTFSSNQKQLWCAHRAVCLIP